jgi:ubiquinone/menaquinone biosynthesis C-methylase UbiE
MINNNKERVYREKEWHNQLYNTDVRASTVKFYSIFNRNHGGIVTSHDKYVLDNVMPDNTVLLDYGCGPGDYLISISRHILSGVGIDISDAYIEGAKYLAIEKGNKNVDFFVMDAMNTSFNDNEFDIIVGQSILHHLDLKRSLNEVKRILKKDGKAYFIEPLATNPLIQLYRILTPKKRTKDEQPFRKYDIKIIKSIFSKTEIEYFSCFTLLSVPFRNSKIFDNIFTFLYGIDKWFLCKKSPFKYLAWTCLLILKV